MQEFTGKVAVITGAASGIGRALASRCVQEGMKVVLADVEGDALTRRGYLTAHAVASTVILAAVLMEPEEAEEKYRKFLAQGIEVANGTQCGE